MMIPRNSAIHLTGVPRSEQISNQQQIQGKKIRFPLVVFVFAPPGFCGALVGGQLQNLPKTNFVEYSDKGRSGQFDWSDIVVKVRKY